MQPPLILYMGPGLAGVTTSLGHFVPKGDSAQFAEWQARLLGGVGVLDARVPPRARILVGLRTYTWFPSLEHAARSEDPWVRNSAAFVLAHLRQVHGVVFVADSQFARIDANLAWLERTVAELRGAGLDPDEIPFVFQLNKRDMPNVLSVRELRALLRTARCDHVESVATRGEGVREALRRALDPLRGAHRSPVPKRPVHGSPRRLFDTDLDWSISSDVSDELEIAHREERLEVGSQITIGWGWPKAGLTRLEAQPGSWRIDVASYRRRFRSRPEPQAYTAGVRISLDATGVERVELHRPPGNNVRDVLIGDDAAVSRLDRDTAPKSVRSALWSGGVGLVRHDARAWFRPWSVGVETNLLTAPACVTWTGIGPDGRVVEIGAIGHSGLELLGQPDWVHHGDVEP